MAQEFLGRGLKFPLQRTENGQLDTARYEESIRQAIWMILGTAKGERIMRPDFGCGIHELVFAVVNSTTINQLAEEVMQALVRWEPRIDIQAVDVFRDPASPQRLLIQLDYRVRTTNNRFNLVYPFYLE